MNTESVSLIWYPTWYSKGIPVLFQGSLGSTKRLVWRVFDVEFSITNYLFWIWVVRVGRSWLIYLQRESDLLIRVSYHTQTAFEKHERAPERLPWNRNVIKGQKESNTQVLKTRCALAWLIFESSSVTKTSVVNELKYHTRWISRFRLMSHTRWLTFSTIVIQTGFRGRWGTANGRETVRHPGEITRPPKLHKIPTERTF